MSWDEVALVSRNSYRRTRFTSSDPSAYRLKTERLIYSYDGEMLSNSNSRFDRHDGCLLNVA